MGGYRDTRDGSIIYQSPRFIGDDVTKFDLLDPVCERARQFLSKSDLFPQLRSNPTLGEQRLEIIFNVGLFLPCFIGMIRIYV